MRMSCSPHSFISTPSIWWYKIKPHLFLISIFEVFFSFRPFTPRDALQQEEKLKDMFPFHLIHDSMKSFPCSAKLSCKHWRICTPVGTTFVPKTFHTFLRLPNFPALWLALVFVLHVICQISSQHNMEPQLSFCQLRHTSLLVFLNQDVRHQPRTGPHVNI